MLLRLSGLYLSKENNPSDEDYEETIDAIEEE